MSSTEKSIPSKKASLYENLFFAAYRIRLAEERIADLYPSDKIESPVHLSIGQEAIAVGVCKALEHKDLVFGSYRSHASYLAKGGSLNAMFAELYGRKTGCGQGKAGSMHLSDSNVGVMGSSAIVAGTIPHAVGAAYAAKLRKTGQIVVSFFGEGATAEGVYHESLNFAQVHRLPVLFVCENNGLAIYTRVSETNSFQVLKHAESYGIHTEYLENGMDFENIHSVTKKLAERLRAGNGPALLEVKTYRYRQHVGPHEDYNIGYRDISEIEEWLRKDPLHTDEILRNRFKAEIENEIEQAVKFADASAFPSQEDLYQDIY